MTLKELIQGLKEIKNREFRDPEVAHCDADYLLLKYINSKEVTDLFTNIEKWYA